MNWLDVKYTNLLSTKLERFKKVGNNYNFRCPICGDSKVNTQKTRGWVLSKQDKTRFFCHNCNASMSLSDFIKQIDMSLYYEYVKDLMIEKSGGVRVKTDVELFADCMKKPQFIKTSALESLKKISQLKHDHPVKLYIDKRKIPTKYQSTLFFAPKFKAFTNLCLPGKFDSVTFDEPRLIIPLLTPDKELFGFQGRSFKPNDPMKYITIMLNDLHPKCFGLDTVVASEPIPALEGPIDAMFIPNAIASCGGRIDSIISNLKYSKDNMIIIYDNEPRNVHTVKKMQSSLDDGYKVCIWPENLIYKDVNNMIIGGMTSQQVTDIIFSNIYSGLAGKLKLSSWNKA